MKLINFSVIVVFLCALFALGAQGPAHAYPGPTWQSGMRVAQFLSKSECNILDEVRRRLGLAYDVEIVRAAYVEYKIARQLAGGYEDRALQRFDRNPGDILQRKAGLYWGGVRGSLNRPLELPGIQRDLYRKKRPEDFSDLLRAFSKAWFAAP